MTPESVIKKNAVWYTIRIMATGLSAFAGVILTKRQLSPQQFLEFNLVMNGVSMINSFVLAWFVQSIVRFFHSFHRFFSLSKTTYVVVLNFIFVGLPAFLIWLNRLGIPSSVVWPLCFMFFNGLFTAVLSVFQAAHKAKLVAIAEIIRSGLLMLGLAIPLLGMTDAGPNYYWAIWSVSTLLPVFYFFMRQHALSSVTMQVDGRQAPAQNNAEVVKQLLRFGLPLTAWVFVSFLMLNADKWYVYVVNISPADSANYVALSDLISRAIGFAFSPIVTSAYPVIAHMYDGRQYKNARALILKVVKWQLIIGGLAIAGFALFHSLIFSLIQIDNTGHSMLLLALAIIAGNVIWQVSAMFHKVIELKTNTMLLVGALSVATAIVYLCYYWLMQPQQLFSIFMVFAFGLIAYLLITIYLFFTHKWPVEQQHETI